MVFAFSAKILNAQSNWYTRISMDIGPSLMVFSLDKNPFLSNRTSVRLNNAWGHHQRIGLNIGKKHSKVFLYMGLQHNVNKIKVDYLKFNNPLIKEGMASQIFDLRYLSIPMGVGRRIKTGEKSELRISLVSEILETFKLRCIDSTINITLIDNTSDNLSSIKSLYSYYNLLFSNVGGVIEYELKVNSVTSFNFSFNANWQPRSSQWIDYGASIYAGGQLEQVRISRGMWRNFMSFGLSFYL